MARHLVVCILRQLSGLCWNMGPMFSLGPAMWFCACYRCVVVPMVWARLAALRSVLAVFLTTRMGFWPHQTGDLVVACPRLFPHLVLWGWPRIACNLSTCPLHHVQHLLLCGKGDLRQAAPTQKFEENYQRNMIHKRSSPVSKYLSFGTLPNRRACTSSVDSVP